MDLRASDELRTGADARLLVKLADGSSVKLGESAQLRLATLQTRKDNVFVSAMNVLQGAFRFTTDALAKSRRRDVTVTVATVTAGIRGTDLWGKAASDRDIVCLIEGRDRSVAAGRPDGHDGSAALVLHRAPGPAGAAGRAGQSRAAQAVGDGDRNRRRHGARPVAAAAGKSCSPRASRRTRCSAVYQQVRAAGYAAELQPRRVAGQARLTTSASRACRRRPRPRRSPARSTGSTASRRRA